MEEQKERQTDTKRTYPKSKGSLSTIMVDGGKLPPQALDLEEARGRGGHTGLFRL